MEFLVAETHGVNVPVIRELGVGRMWIARTCAISTYPGEVWGFDNGAYRDWVRGEPFNVREYEKTLAKALAKEEPPLLAVLPDIPAAGPRSADYSLEWLDQLGDILPWYLAVQDGMTDDHVLPFQGRIAGIFLGGTDRFKSTAGYWVQVAREFGFRFHYGRCGTDEKVAHALSVGAHSADSALPLFRPGRLEFIRRVIRNGGPPQHDLFRSFPHQQESP